jgi:hypothetical protein
MTAADLAAERERLLREDPEYRADMQRVEAGRAVRRDRLRVAAAPVLEQLATAGHPVTDIYLLKPPCASAVPILLKHLPGEYREPLRAAIARMLAVP